MAKRNRPQEIPTIVIRNLQRHVRFDLVKLQKAAVQIIEAVARMPRGRTRFRSLDEVAVVLVSDSRMAALHRQFLGRTGPTDVITFDHGEIIVSVETARRNARSFRSSVMREVQLYIVHGLLHLHGYDDQSPRAAAQMGRVQERILNSLN